nr:Bro-e [Calliteara abietis nucleopolyhedrovirus]
MIKIAMLKLNFVNGPMEVFTIVDGKLNWMAAKPFIDALKFADSGERVLLKCVSVNNQTTLQQIQSYSYGPITSAMDPQTKFINRKGVSELITASRQGFANRSRNNSGCSSSSSSNRSSPDRYCSDENDEFFEEIDNNDNINANYIEETTTTTTNVNATDAAAASSDAVADDDADASAAAAADVCNDDNDDTCHANNSEGDNFDQKLDDFCKKLDVWTKMDKLFERNVCEKNETINKLTSTLAEANEKIMSYTDVIIQTNNELILANKNLHNSYQGVHQLSNRMADIAQNAISKPNDFELLLALIVNVMKTANDRQSETATATQTQQQQQQQQQRFTLKRRMSVDNSDIVFKSNYVSKNNNSSSSSSSNKNCASGSGINSGGKNNINCTKSVKAQKGLRKSKPKAKNTNTNDVGNNKIAFDNMTKEEIVDFICSYMTDRQIDVIINKAKTLSKNINNKTV